MKYMYSLFLIGTIALTSCDEDISGGSTCYACIAINECYLCTLSSEMTTAALCETNAAPSTVTYTTPEQTFDTIVPQFASDFKDLLVAFGYTCEVTSRDTVELDFCEDGSGAFTVSTTVNGAAGADSIITGQVTSFISDRELAGFDCQMQ